MLEVLNQTILELLVQGLRDKAVIYRHAFKCTSSIITVIG